MGFTGKERDAETGLDYFGARYMSAAQGRFTSPDEWQGGAVDPFTGQQIQQPGPLPYADISLPQSLNKYAYVMNNPLRYTDPDGHCTNVLTCAWSGWQVGSKGGFWAGVAGAVGGAGLGLAMANADKSVPCYGSCAGSGPMPGTPSFNRMMEDAQAQMSRQQGQGGDDGSPASPGPGGQSYVLARSMTGRSVAMIVEE